MANCPNCGSNHIQLKTETDVNWGRAIVGYAAFGVVGGAVGAVTGEDRNVNACLDCGTSWKASDLYNTLQIIKNLTGKTLNLAKEEHRLYMNNFINEIIPYIEEISKVEKEGERLILEIQGKDIESKFSWCVLILVALGLGWGGIMLFIHNEDIIGKLTGLVFFMTICILLIKMSIYRIKKEDQSSKKKMQDTKKRVEIMKSDAEEQYKKQLQLFMKTYLID